MAATQRSLFDQEPAPAPVAVVVPAATLRERLMEALRRDVDSLSDARYMATCPADVPDLIRERVVDYRARLARLEGEGK